jgi:hypothetical protein
MLLRRLADAAMHGMLQHVPHMCICISMRKVGLQSTTIWLPAWQQ